MIEIDGGARRVPKKSVSGTSWQGPVGAQCGWTGATASTVGVVCLCVPGLEAVGVVCAAAGAIIGYVGVAAVYR